MLLQLHEWGARDAPTVVCLHGIGGHGRRFRRLAEERLARRFRVLAPDLRGHGFSSWEPPWTLASQLADVLETVEAAGVDRASWIGHSYGGRLVLELAAHDPARLESAVLLDPAIQLLPHVGYDFAEREFTLAPFTSPEEAVDDRLAFDLHAPRAFVEEDVREHLEQLRDGRWRYRYCPSAVATGYGELCTPPPPPETLRCPTQLVHATDFGLVLDHQLAAYEAALGGRLDVVPVPGGHMVFWDAYAQVADAVEAFLGAAA
jgi:lipase